ncbi:hypothetical protein MNBD_GAMMA26-1626 [hydrothermal vent metagenome]|uniref:Cytochrome c7-like domain-containing protein n=1 Tax=hydrothermal vent metagenome TaxID=652676 RepID=A0A3B1AI62_9ZZZZ
MLSIKPRSNAALLMAVLVFTLLVGNSTAYSSEADFLRAYINNYDQQQFAGQVILVQEHKELIPSVIKMLAQEAQSEGQTQSRTLYLLNLASSIASMHMHQNGDGKPLSEVEPIIREEVAKAKAKAAEAMKWKTEERVIGNFVMMRHIEEEAAQGLSPVLYPHWQHRIFFECKVCHTSIFRMQRWANDITHEKMAAGEQCGKCHNGTVSFSAADKKQCSRCHLAATSEAQALHDPLKFDQAALKKTADRIGSKWRPENLPDGKMPVDGWGYIDWLELKKNNVFTPLISLDDNTEEETIDGKILFESSSDYVNNVLFDHRVHSDWITCDTCHPEIFVPELSGNKVKMIEISQGRWCGHCHGKVSFTFANCKRCHSVKKGEQIDGALVHTPGK